MELFCDLAREGPRLHRVAGGEVVLVTVRGPDKLENEDSAAILDHPSGTLLAVADGMGGQKAGARASRVALETLAEKVTRALDDGTSLRHALLDGIGAANRAVLDLRLGAGTTLVAVVLHEGTAQPVHVGDSVALHIGQRGKIKAWTVSHSPTGYAVEAGLLNEEEAMFDESRHILTNHLGWEGMRIEVGARLPFAPRDTFLLASDGVADNVSLDEIVQISRQRPLEAAATVLRDLALARMQDGESPLGKPDDMTFLLYRRVPQPPAKVPTGEDTAVVPGRRTESVSSSSGTSGQAAPMPGQTREGLSEPS